MEKLIPLKTAAENIPEETSHKNHLVARGN
jgi:hypothetical protein